MGFSRCHLSVRMLLQREVFFSTSSIYLLWDKGCTERQVKMFHFFPLYLPFFRINQEGSPLFSKCDPWSFGCVCCLLFLVLLWSLSMSSCWCSKYPHLGLGALLSLSLRPSSTAQAFWIASSPAAGDSAQAHSVCSRPRLETTQPYCTSGNVPWDHSPGLGCCSVLIVTHVSRTFQ